MGKESRHIEKKKSRKWAWVVPLCILILIGLLRLFLVTGFAHRLVKNKIVEAAEQSLNPRLAVGKLSGNLLRHITLTNITLTQDSTVASIDTLYLNYNLLSLLGNTFKINKIKIIHPVLKLYRQKDSTWNAEHWLKPSSDTSSSTTSYSIRHFVIERGRVDVTDPAIQQDSSFVVEDLKLASNDIYYSGDHYRASVDTLRFSVDHTRLDSPVRLAASAEAGDSLFHLSEFTVTTAHSALHASGKINFVDTTGHFKLTARPLSWKDVAAYEDSSLIRSNITMSLGISLTQNRGTINFSAKAAGIRDFSAKAVLQKTPTLALTSLKMSAEQLDLSTFLNDTTAQSLTDLDLKTTGRVPFNDYRHGHLQAAFSAKNLRVDDFHLDALKGSFLLDRNRVQLMVKPIEKGQFIIARAKAQQIWKDEPLVSAVIKGRNMNPAVWLDNDDYSGRLNFSGRVSGKGWLPENKLWSYKVVMDSSKLMGQSVSRALFSGRFNQQQLTNESDIFLGSGDIHLEAGASNLQEIPSFFYSLNLQKFNLADINGFEAYPSVINGTMKGHGRGNSLQNLRLKTSMLIDSSFFMREPVSKLHLKAQVIDSILTVHQAVLKSGIADGSLRAHIHLQDVYDPDNRLHFQAKIKDVSSFASFAGVDILDAKGTAEGQIKPKNQRTPMFVGHINLHHLNYGNEFKAQELQGQIGVDLGKNPQYLVKIDITKPMISSVDMHKITLQTSGRLNDNATTGDFHLNITGNNKGKIVQSGFYRLKGDTTIAKITDFTLSSPEQTFILAEPFRAKLISGSLKTDTLQMKSKEDSALVELAVQYDDSLHQSGFVKLKNLQLAPFQKAFLGQVYLKGTVFGNMSMIRKDTSLKVDARVTMNNFSYQGAKLDRLQLHANVENNRLTGRFDVQKDGKNIVEAGMDIPFSLQVSDSIRKRFSRKPIEGYLTVNSVKLNQFSKLLKQLDISNTTGTVRMHGSLSGTVARPQFNAKLSFLNGKLSGIPIDSLTASLNYKDKLSTLDLNAALISLHQKMLTLNATMPFKVNIQVPDISLPDEKDSISVKMEASDFNLKVMNDFLDHKMARNLEGFINGDIDVSGPLDNLQMNGVVTLNKGALRLVYLGIRADHMQSKLEFQPGKIKLANFEMESGKGSLHGHGQISLDKMEPKDLDLSLKAQNLKVANTADYQAIINADINVDGTVNSPKMSGKLTVLSGFVKLHNFGQKSVENVRLDTTLAAPATQSSLYDSLSLNLDLSINPRFFVRNERYLKMEFGLDGDLRILKKPSKSMQIFGTIKTVDGYAEPLGKHFDVQKGVLAFSGPPDNPELNIRTLYEPPRTNETVKIWYIIEGTVEKPQFKYESDPPMDLSSILSYTLFGQPMYALQPGAQSATSAIGHKLASNFVMGFLANKVESIATTKLGIDIVKIENTHVGGKSGTAITTGWYINPRVFFAIQNVITGSTPSPGFYLEYSLKKNLKLILSQGTGNREGIGADLQWEYDY